MSAAWNVPLPLSRERRGPSPQAMGDEGLLLKALTPKKTLTQPSPAKTGEGLKGRML